MAQPQLVCPNFCQETAPTPTPSGLDDYQQAGRVAPFLAFNSQLSEGDPFPYTAWDGTDVEIAIGVFREGPPESIERPSDPTLVYYSTNGGALVNWLGGATINILSGTSALWFLSLMGGIQSVGFSARTGEHAWAFRAFQLTHALGGGDFLFQLVNPAGTSGNPQFRQLYDVLRRDVLATSAQRTMLAELILGGVTTQINGLPHEIRGSGGGGDVIAKFTRNGSQDYLGQLGVGGSLRRFITANASDENDADTIEGYKWSDAINYAHSADGFQVLPSGLIVNWGLSPEIFHGSSANITLPKAYSSSHLQAWACPGNWSTTPLASDVIATPNGLTQVTIAQRNTQASSGGFRWLSIGI